ncbi:MAG: SDR family NAD(P)-dependent oxidoreductase [Spirochaetes bacterium]|nr:SDR family NAD(P)-dependent oxidoreductase [Spirochaetota bacterium]
MDRPLLMNGKTCLVTGAASGHGEAVAKALAAAGAELYILDRNEAGSARVRDEIAALTGRPPEIVFCDLSSMKDIRRAAGEFLAAGRPLHLLVNNAGMVSRAFRETVDGVEETMAVNFLALFQLTMLLLERIRASAPARIVNVSSDAHRIASIDPDDMERRRGRYSIMGAYGRSKLAVTYFTVELARRLEGTGVTVNALDPGPVASNIARKEGLIPKMANAIIQLTFPRPERAARTCLHLAMSRDVEGMTGGYWRFMRQKEPKLTGGPELGARLWEVSARMTGIG